MTHFVSLNEIISALKMKTNKINMKIKKIELMYRSSKLNEERVNVMRSNSPLPNINDNEGKESIIRYLPPINLNDVC